MSIEKQISDLIEAVQANTAALEAHTKILTNGIARKTQAQTQPDEAEEPPKTTKKKPAAQEKVSKKKPKKVEISLDDVKAAFGEYLAVKDKEELATRRSNVSAILAPFNVGLVRDLPEESFEDALLMLQDYIDQDAAGGEAEEDDGEDESLI